MRNIQNKIYVYIQILQILDSKVFLKFYFSSRLVSYGAVVHIILDIYIFFSKRNFESTFTKLIIYILE